MKNLKPQDLYRISSIAFRVFVVIFAIFFAMNTSRVGFRTLAPFLGTKTILRFIGIPDMAALVAFAFIIAAPFCIHFVLRDYLLVNAPLDKAINPKNGRQFLWTFAIAVIVLDALSFYWGISELTFWDESPSRAPAIILTCAYISLFPVFGFIDLYLSLKARSPS